MSNLSLLPPVDAKAAARVIMPPDDDTNPVDSNRRTVFLAGTIDQLEGQGGRNWRYTAIEHLEDLEITIYNPLRHDWDSSWKQHPSFQPFKDQVTWELKGLEEVDVIMLYLEPGSKSPISLLELGTFRTSKRMVVGCPEGFYRRGNVQIFCERYGIELVDTFEALLVATKRRLLEPRSEDV